MTEINPLYHSLIFGTLMSILDKMGISPMLIARQTARMLTPIIENMTKDLGRNRISNIEEFIEYFQGVVKTGGLADPKSFEMILSDNCLSTKVTNCIFLHMAQYGKSLGYSTCPLCSANVLLAGVFNSLGLGDVSDIKVETTGNTCSLKLVIMEK